MPGSAPDPRPSRSRRSGSRNGISRRRTRDVQAASGWRPWRLAAILFRQGGAAPALRAALQSSDQSIGSSPEVAQPVVRAPEWVRSDERPAALHRVDRWTHDVWVAVQDASARDGRADKYTPGHEHDRSGLAGDGAKDAVGHRPPPDVRVPACLACGHSECRVQQEHASASPTRGATSGSGRSCPPELRSRSASTIAAPPVRRAPRTRVPPPALRSGMGPGRGSRPAPRSVVSRPAPGTIALA